MDQDPSTPGPTPETAPASGPAPGPASSDFPVPEPTSPTGSDSDRPADPGRYPWATWGPWVAIGGTLAALVLGLVLALPILALDGGSGDDLGTTARIGIQAMTACGFLLIPFLIASNAGTRVDLAAAARRLGFVSFRVGTALKWIGIAIVAYLAFALTWAELFGAPEQDDIAGDLGPVWTQVLLIVIAAPFAEEVCFRGMLFGGIRSRLRFPLAAVGAGVIFGLLHYSTGWSTVPQLAALGVAFALIYEKTGSIWPPILFHVFNNAFVLATLN